MILMVIFIIIIITNNKTTRIMSKVIIFTEALTYSMIKIFFISYKWECPSVLQLWCFY